MNGRLLGRDRAGMLPGGGSRSVEALAAWLIRLAARSTPASLGERLEEEWLADLGERRGPMAQLRLALGCWWATRVITREHPAGNLLAAGSAAGQKLMTGSAQHDPAYFSRRTTAFLLIVCLHALVICGLAVTLGRTMQGASPPETLATVLPGPPTPTPPPLDPNVPMTGIERVPPEAPLIPVTDPNPILDLVAEPPQLPASPPVRTVNRVVGGPGRGFPATTDYYPPAAIRLKEMGTAAVQVCVDANGRLTAAPVIAESSGSARLDEGALRLARAGSGHYRATTEDGRPVGSCYPFRIRFELKE